MEKSYETLIRWLVQLGYEVSFSKWPHTSITAEYRMESDTVLVSLWDSKNGERIDTVREVKEKGFFTEKEADSIILNAVNEWYIQAVDKYLNEEV